MKNQNQDITEIEDNRTEYRVSSLAGCGEYLVQQEELNGRGAGVYYVAGENAVSFLCSPVVVEGMYRDIDNTGWGRLLILKDHDDRCHNYIMSAATLGKDEASIVGELRDHGVTVTTKRKYHHLVADYLLNTAPRKSQRIRSTAKSGWQDDNVYILPDNSVIGESPEQYILQRQTSASICSSSGSIEDWQQNVASLCRGNSRLIFAVSAAFSSAMLTPTGHEGGGFHLFGTSSDGKTTTLHVAASAVGRPPKYIQTWRATDNGLEGIAKLHNDSLLILDELGEIAPQDAGKVSYFLANGSGKTRARVTGDAKPKAEWRLNYLSSGEITLSEHMAEAGKQAKAGQEVRHVDIPANAGAGKGVFENIHTCGTPAEFADLLKQRASQYYGTAFRIFIEKYLTADSMRDDATEEYIQGFLSKNLPAASCGQVKRVAHKFALVAAAGMLASVWEITGWGIEETEDAVGKVFQDWLAHRAHTDSHESVQIVSRIQSYLQQYTGSRFIEAAYSLKGKLQAVSEQRRPPLQLDGFIINKSEGNEYYLFSGAFDRIIQGMNRSTTIKFLVDGGYLVRGSDGRNQVSKRLPGFPQTKVYHLTHKIMFDDVVTEATEVTEENPVSEQQVLFE